METIFKNIFSKYFNVTLKEALKYVDMFTISITNKFVYNINLKSNLEDSDFLRRLNVYKIKIIDVLSRSLKYEYSININILSQNEFEIILNYKWYFSRIPTEITLIILSYLDKRADFENFIEHDSVPKFDYNIWHFLIPGIYNKYDYYMNKFTSTSSTKFRYLGNGCAKILFLKFEPLIIQKFKKIFIYRSSVYYITENNELFKFEQHVVTKINNVTQIEVSQTNNHGLFVSNGRIHTFGSNGYGELGMKKA